MLGRELDSKELREPGEVLPQTLFSHGEGWNGAASGPRKALGLVWGSHMAASGLPAPPPLALGLPFARDLYCSQPDGFSCGAVPRVDAVPWVGRFRCIMAE